MRGGWVELTCAEARRCTKSSLPLASRVGRQRTEQRNLQDEANSCNICFLLPVVAAVVLPPSLAMQG